jgi:hypothetical protein
MPLDETISTGQAGHITDHQEIAATLNGLSASYVAKAGGNTITDQQTFTDTGTSADVATISVIRTASYAGGTPGFVNGAIKVQTDVSAGVTAYEWGIRSVMNNSATAGENVAIYGQASKTAGAGPTWAGVFEVKDTSGVANPASGCVALEIDVDGTGTDASLNRIGVDLVARTLTGAQCEAFAGVRISGGGTGKWINGFLVNGTVTNGVRINTTAASAGVAVGGTTTVALSVDGTTTVGLDFSTATISGSAIRVARQQKIAWEPTSTLTQQMAGGANILQFIHTASERIGIDYDNSALRSNGTKVIGPRKTGWAVATGTATRTAFDTTTVTTAQLAERVKALIDDLHGTAGHGLIGT